MPLLNELAQKSFDATRTYGEVVHFVHVYVIEPHPQPPDPSPYRGRPWEREYSTFPQPLTYAERVPPAAATALLLEGDQTLVVDALDPGGLVNPVWCTYGPAANAGFLIGRNGTIEVAQTWLDVAEMEAAIDALLAP